MKTMIIKADRTVDPSKSSHEEAINIKRALSKLTVLQCRPVQLTFIRMRNTCCLHLRRYLHDPHGCIQEEVENQTMASKMESMVIC